MKNENRDPSCPVVPALITPAPVLLAVSDKNSRHSHTELQQHKERRFLRLWFKYFFVIPISIVIFTAFIVS